MRDTDKNAWPTGGRRKLQRQSWSRPRPRAVPSIYSHSARTRGPGHILQSRMICLRWESDVKSPCICRMHDQNLRGVAGTAALRSRKKITIGKGRLGRRAHLLAACVRNWIRSRRPADHVQQTLFTAPCGPDSFRSIDGPDGRPNYRFRTHTTDGRIVLQMGDSFCSRQDKR